MDRRVFGGWTAVVSLLALVDALGWWKDFADGANSVGLGLAQTMASSLTWVPVNVGVYLLTVWFPVGRPHVVRAVLVHVAGYLVALCWLSGRMFLFDPVLHWLPPGRGFGAEYLRDLGAYLAMYFEWVGVAHGVYYFTQYRRRREQLTRAREELARAELQALRAQVRPHFLFNAMNTIASFVHDDPLRAEEMVVRLSTLLRRSLEHDGSLEVTLREDLEVLAAYVDIEQARFEDRLAVEWRLHPGALNALVPPLLLQPLVENAVRHGISPRDAPGTVTISARPDGSWLQLIVADDGVGLRTDRSRSGIGLANARARLTQMYGTEHLFSVEPRPAGGVEATVRLPLRTAPA
ncbi:histidine kinase [Spirillospora sp. NPDC049652]